MPTTDEERRRQFQQQQQCSAGSGASERYPLGSSSLQPPPPPQTTQQQQGQPQVQQQQQPQQRYHQNMGSLDRYHSYNIAMERRYPPSLNYQPGSKSRRYHYYYHQQDEHHGGSAFDHHYMPIASSQQQHEFCLMTEPPSPAPANDRFIVPPPSTPSPPPPVSPAYDKRYFHHHQHAPHVSHQNQVQQQQQQQQPPAQQPQPTPMDRYYTNRGWYNTAASSSTSASYQYIPPNAHMPVERYVPQVQDYYHGYKYPSSGSGSASDPYMRRDLQFHRPQQVAQRIRTPSRIKCCSYQDPYLKPSPSPGASSSSSSSSSSINPGGQQDSARYVPHEKTIPARVLQPSPVPPPATSPQPQTPTAPAASVPVQKEVSQSQIIQAQLQQAEEHEDPLEDIDKQCVLSTKQLILTYIRESTACFFGVGMSNSTLQDNFDKKWQLRRRRHATRNYSEFKDTPEEPERQHRPDILPGHNQLNQHYAYDDNDGKDSIITMSQQAIKYIINTITQRGGRHRRQKRCRSYAPSSISPSVMSGEDCVFFGRPDTSPIPTPTCTSSSGWRLAHNSTLSATVGCTRICTSVLDRVLDNSNRQRYGPIMKSPKRHTLNHLQDYRPYFTYWITSVHILVMIISMLCYGLGPFGMQAVEYSGQVLVTSLSLQQVEYHEPANMWFGLRIHDLIHLGAKFAPCMRQDHKIHAQIDKTRAKERETACCIRNDDSGCVQSSQADCSIRGLRPSKTHWKKWSAGESGPGGRISGSVCGLDPKFCDAPASVHPYEWPDDITKWPICRKTATSSVQKRRGGGGGSVIGNGGAARDRYAEHMVCEVIGHPCCIGIHGTCRITTREYCDFVQGRFHEEANLCSQVSCMTDICGMLPFAYIDHPDQFYRLWTSLFLHAGLIHLAFTFMLHFYLLRNLEKLLGSLRIAIIYMASGVIGNLGGALIMSYWADVGPTPSLIAIVGCHLMELYNQWEHLRSPTRALTRFLSILFAFFVAGTLPMLSNYAHLISLIVGCILFWLLSPQTASGVSKQAAHVWMLLVSIGGMCVLLLVAFYWGSLTGMGENCRFCAYFDCLPLLFGASGCGGNDGVRFGREEAVL